MASWIRSNQSKIIFLSNQLKIYYLQIPYDSSLKYTATSSRSRVLENPVWDFIKKHSEFCNNVRFYAAPVQVISRFLSYFFFFWSLCNRTVLIFMYGQLVFNFQCLYACGVSRVWYVVELQAKVNKEEKTLIGPRLNEKITAPAVRLVGDEGTICQFDTWLFWICYEWFFFWWYDQVFHSLRKYWIYKSVKIMDVCRA